MNILLLVNSASHICFSKCKVQKKEVLFMREQKGRSLLDFPSSYSIIDVETTGLDPAKDSLIEVAALKVRDFKIIDSYSSLINPGIEIDAFISNLTGITNDQLRLAPDSEDVLRHLYTFLSDDIIVGHNVNFDINFLYDNFNQYLGIFFTNDFIDTLRLSKRYYKGVPSYKLDALAKHLNIPLSISHRALADCETTHQLYINLIEAHKHPSDYEEKLLESLSFDASNPFYNKRIALKGLPQLYSYSFMEKVFEKCNANFSDIFYKSCDYIIFSKYTYKRYKDGEYSEKFTKADKLVNDGTLSVLSEEQWCDMLNLPIPVSTRHTSKVSAKDISTDKTDFDETHPLYGKQFVFTGTLEKMSRKDAMQLVVDFGGSVGNSVTKKTNYLVLGNNDYCSSIKDGKSNKQKKAETLKLGGNDIEIISENVFYDMASDL